MSRLRSFSHPAFRGFLTRRPLACAVLACALVSVALLWPEHTGAHHPDPGSPYAVNEEMPGLPNGMRDRTWGSKDHETCAHNQHHSGADSVGNPLNGHQAIELLNQFMREESDYPLFRRMKGGGVEVTPIFNCLPNFWGWVLYREDGGQKVFIDDLETGGIVQSPGGWAFDNASNHYFPNPQHERPTWDNKVSMPDSAELMAGLGYGSSGTSTPMFMPRLNSDGDPIDDDHIVFKYNSKWDNGVDANIRDIFIIGGNHSVRSDEDVHLKIWTAQSIEKVSDANPDDVLPNPFSDKTDLRYVNWQTWPRSADPSARQGYSVGQRSDGSVWDRIVRRLNPMYWIGAVARPAIFASMDAACGIWERAANVQSDGCVRQFSYSPHSEGSSGRLEDGSPGVRPMGRITADGVDIRNSMYRGVEVEREVFFTKRMGAGSDSSPGHGEVLARLQERGYPVQVAAPSLQTPNWKRNAPNIASLKIVNPPASPLRGYIPGETLYIEVTFTEPVGFLAWTPSGGGLREEAASYQTLHNLRFHMVGLVGCQGTDGSYEKRACESAEFDVGAASTRERFRLKYPFQYVIPDGVTTRPGTSFGPSADNGGQYLGAGSLDNYGTPFWFAHDDWREANPNPANRDELEEHFQVGANFAGPDRATDDDYKAVRDFSLESESDLSEYDIADVTLTDSLQFVPYNSIAPGNIKKVLSFREHSRNLLSFTGLLKGTPASVTYERGFVVLGWTVMLNVVFALFVLFIAWAAITSIVRPLIDGNSGVGWKELAPRIIMGAIAVGSSFWWCKLMIDLADALTRYVAEALGFSPGDVLHIGLAISHLFGTSDTAVGLVVHEAGKILIMLVILLVLLFFLVLGLLILGQLILRLVVINLLMILAPIGLAMFILPDTSGWGRKWVQLWMVTLFVHALQIIGMALALSFVRATIPIGDEAVGQNEVLWALLLGTFALYLTWKLPSMLGDGGLSEGFLPTMTMVVNTAAHLPAAMRTGVNLMAAYGTGGMGAVAMSSIGASSTSMSHFGGGQNITSPVPNSSGGQVNSQRP